MENIKEVENVSKFILPLLEPDTEKQATASDCLQHSSNVFYFVTIFNLFLLIFFHPQCFDDSFSVLLISQLIGKTF